MALLQPRLDRMRENTRSKVSPETLAIMQRTAKELADSGLAERALGEGATLPPATLPNQHGEPISLGDHLARGPLVLTIFRGHW